MCTKSMQAKDCNNKSGGEMIVCPYNEELDAIIGARAATCLPIVLENGGSTSNLISTYPEGIQLYILILFFASAYASS